MIKLTLITIFSFTFLSFKGCTKNETILLKTQLSQLPTTKPVDNKINRFTEVRPLSGKLNNIPMINSNSPEWLRDEGILLSTFPSTQKAFPQAHLGYPLIGKFELFDHHYIINQPESKTIYLGFLLHNPNKKAISLSITEAASNLIIAVPNSKSKNPLDGSRASDAILKGIKDSYFPSQITLQPNEYKMIMNKSIDTLGLPRNLNGRSSHIRFESKEVGSNTPALINFASLAMYGKKDSNGKIQPPTLTQWRQLLEKGDLAKPRDKTPTPPQKTDGNLIYSRVSGIQQGTQWQTQLTNSGKNYLEIPQDGKSLSFVISTIRKGTLGTNQIQAANLLTRYPDTAYEAHGNYGVHYDLTAPLFNPHSQPKKVTVALETPLKSENNQVLSFDSKSDSSAVFSGLVRLRYLDDAGLPVESYITVKQSRGQVVKPLLTLNLKPQENRKIRVDFLYPPDSTPPQVLTFTTNPN